MKIETICLPVCVVSGRVCVISFGVCVVSFGVCVVLFRRCNVSFCVVSNVSRTKKRKITMDYTWMFLEY